jgi:hypothetical protein
MSIVAAIAVGALTGLALGIVISLTTDIPLAPEAGLVLGALAGWLSRREGTYSDVRAVPAPAARLHRVVRHCRPKRLGGCSFQGSRFSFA